MARKPRPASYKPKDFLVPINIKDFGNDDKDPCFSKLYDLMASECQSCGDNELCAIGFMARQRSRMIEQENQDKNLDLVVSDLEKDKDLKDYILPKLEKGERKTLIVGLASRKFKVDKEYINKLINNNGHGCT